MSQITEPSVTAPYNTNGFSLYRPGNTNNVEQLTNSTSIPSYMRSKSSRPSTASLSQTQPEQNITLVKPRSRPSTSKARPLARPTSAYGHHPGVDAHAAPRTRLAQAASSRFDKLESIRNRVWSVSDFKDRRVNVLPVSVDVGDSVGVESDGDRQVTSLIDFDAVNAAVAQDNSGLNTQDEAVAMQSIMLNIKDHDQLEHFLSSRQRNEVIYRNILNKKNMSLNQAATTTTTNMSISTLTNVGDDGRSTTSLLNSLGDGDGDYTHLTPTQLKQYTDVILSQLNTVKMGLDETLNDIDNNSHNRQAIADSINVARSQREEGPTLNEATILIQQWLSHRLKTNRELHSEIATSLNVMSDQDWLDLGNDCKLPQDLLARLRQMQGDEGEYLTPSEELVKLRLLVQQRDIEISGMSQRRLELFDEKSSLRLQLDKTEKELAKLNKLLKNKKLTGETKVKELTSENKSLSKALEDLHIQHEALKSKLHSNQLKYSDIESLLSTTNNKLNSALIDLENMEGSDKPKSKSNRFNGSDTNDNNVKRGTRGLDDYNNLIKNAGFNPNLDLQHLWVSREGHKYITNQEQQWVQLRDIAICFSKLNPNKDGYISASSLSKLLSKSLNGNFKQIHTIVSLLNFPSSSPQELGLNENQINSIYSKLIDESNHHINNDTTADDKTKENNDSDSVKVSFSRFVSSMLANEPTHNKDAVNRSKHLLKDIFMSLSKQFPKFGNNSHDLGQNSRSVEVEGDDDDDLNSGHINNTNNNINIIPNVLSLSYESLLKSISTLLPEVGITDVNSLWKSLQEYAVDYHNHNNTDNNNNNNNNNDSDTNKSIAIDWDVFISLFSFKVIYRLISEGFNRINKAVVPSDNNNNSLYIEHDSIYNAISSIFYAQKGYNLGTRECLIHLLWLPAYMSLMKQFKSIYKEQIEQIFLQYDIVVVNNEDFNLYLSLITIDDIPLLSGLNLKNKIQFLVSRVKEYNLKPLLTSVLQDVCYNSKQHLISNVGEVTGDPVLSNDDNVENQDDNDVEYLPSTTTTTTATPSSNTHNHDNDSAKNTAFSSVVGSSFKRIMGKPHPAAYTSSVAYLNRKLQHSLTEAESWKNLYEKQLDKIRVLESQLEISKSWKSKECCHHPELKSLRTDRRHIIKNNTTD